MTTGVELIQRLGLSNFTEVKICRVLDGPHRLHFIYVDSAAPQVPITKVRLNTWLPRVGAYRYPFEDIGSSLPDRRSRTTPLLDLKDWNGILFPGTFILIDLAGRYGKHVTYLWEQVLKEEVFLKDFAGNFGASELTQGFQKDREIGGQQEVKTAKLIQCELDENGNLIWSWLTDPTTYESPVVKGQPGRLKYPKGVLPGETDETQDFKIQVNTSKTYTLQLQVVDFLKWLDTAPDKSVLGPQDVKEILRVCPVRFWSSSPAFHWQGMNAMLSKLDGSIHPTDIMPKHWDKYHGDVYFLDKHLSGLLKNISFWINPMASMATKYLRGKGLL